ncbi:aromatic-ring-hydroxylating dioxygenase subunit beta [Vreelandella titanicae]|uniref:Aromatic-ring-hydroxylating dioxygenase subunit beta n=1 Tax=Vreelandella sp. SM1641 TaxID=3126101 RepID=A0AAU7XME6_9GAMM
MNTIDNESLLWQVTQFIWHEAAILDAKEYDAWLDLWQPEGLYIIPIEDADDYAAVLNLCYDDDKMRRDRIKRFQDGFSISSAPPAVTVRTLSRFVIDAVDGNTVVVSCAEHLVEDKFGRQRIWAANVRYTLTSSDTGFRLQEKVVRLLNSDGVLNSFSYLF